MLWKHFKIFKNWKLKFMDFKRKFSFYKIWWRVPKRKSNHQKFNRSKTNLQKWNLIPKNRNRRSQTRIKRKRPQRLKSKQKLKRVPLQAQQQVLTILNQIMKIMKSIVLRTKKLKLNLWVVKKLHWLRTKHQLLNQILRSFQTHQMRK